MTLAEMSAGDRGREDRGARAHLFETPAAADVSLTIPAAKLPAKSNDYIVEMYFTALGATGSELRLTGDPAHPLSVAVRSSDSAQIVSTTTSGAVVVSKPVKQPNPILKKWWLWTAVGGVVVLGAALGGGLGWYYGRDTSHVDVNLSSR